MGSGNKTSVPKVLPVHWRNFSLSQTANKSPDRRKVCLEESILLCSTTRGIQPTAADTGAITQHRTNLQKLNLQSCNVSPTPTTMLTSQTSPVSAAPPSGRGMGGLETEFLTTLDTTMIEMELVEDTDLTENVWGADSFGVFESNDFGLCAPANLQMKTLLRLRMLTSCNGLSMIKQSLYKKT